MNGQSSEEHFEPYTPAPSTSDVLNAFVACLAVSSPAEREMMITYLRSKVCIECGAPNPNCQCWEREESIPS